MYVPEWKGGSVMNREDMNREESDGDRMEISFQHFR